MEKKSEGITIHLTDEELSKLVNYVQKYGTGGFQSLIRKILIRNLEGK